MHEILTVDEMYAADQAAKDAGIDPYDLMEAAGRGVAEAVLRLMPAQPAAVLCGPGNNGGDGFVAARRLKAAGREATVFLLGERDALEGEAARAAAAWDGDVRALTEKSLDGAGLAVDALFGAGLSRALEGAPAGLARTAAERRLPVVAVDVPSGLAGDLGAPKDGGPSFAAALTVTFFRKKPAHVLFPGAQLCGDVVLHDIGVPASVLGGIKPRALENAPALWREALPRPAAQTHKHARGRLAVVSGGAFATGAARLAARAGQRAGAGFVTLFGDAEATRVNAAHETSIVLQAVERGAAMRAPIDAFEPAAVVVGPGAGVDDATRDLVLGLLGSSRPAVIDADALSAFESDPGALFGALGPSSVLTPHAGEFARLFPDEAAAASSKIDKARAAAARSGATVLFKGPDTVIARPDGAIVVNTMSSPFLASAGSGDVLAGLIGGLLAQGMEPFAAACAAAWIQGRAGRGVGAGLVAEDLVGALPPILRALL